MTAAPLDNSDFFIHPLFSGSKGNASLIWTAGSTILVDAGVSLKCLSALLGPRTIDAIFISHDHKDHVRGLKKIVKKFCCPVFLTKSAYVRVAPMLKEAHVHFIEPEKTVYAGDFSVSVFHTHHDSVGSAGFVFHYGGKKLGYLTDTGHICETIASFLSECDGLLLESDYDDEAIMLFDGYPQNLKNRIRGSFGHLSNLQMLSFVRDQLDLERTKFIIAAHLSQNTNSPDIFRLRLSEIIPDRFHHIFHTAPLVEPLSL